MKSLVIFCPYPFDEAPSQRFRFEQYLGWLQANGFKLTILPFYNQSTWKGGVKKLGLLATGRLMSRVAIQFSRLIYAIPADYIFIHREIVPFGPPVIEWILAKVFRKKIIYDFDDAIWLTDKTNEGWFEKTIRWRGKVRRICNWSYKVSCGNEYLCSFARQFNNNVILNPTTIDTEKVHNRMLFQDALQSPEQLEKKITIGWTGSYSTLKYLQDLGPVLQRLVEKYPSVCILVIADRPPQMNLNGLVFKRWTQETEIKDLCQVDIGIMPLPDDEWAKGKCGFKALQYMALEIPAVVSPVAVNKCIVTPGVHGFWCETKSEWIDRLSQLIADSSLRKEMGKNGRIKIEQEYSVLSNKENFLALFR